MKRHLYLNRRSWHDRGLKSTVQIHDPSQSCSQSPDKYRSVSRLERRQQQRASPEAIRHAAFSDFFLWGRVLFKIPIREPHFKLRKRRHVFDDLPQTHFQSPAPPRMEVVPRSTSSSKTPSAHEEETKKDDRTHMFPPSSHRPPWSSQRPAPITALAQPTSSPEHGIGSYLPPLFLASSPSPQMIGRFAPISVRRLLQQ